MKKSRRGTRYAVLGFVLIGVVVLGGMSWATEATWQLTKLKRREQHLEKVRNAIGRMDDYVLGLWKVEAGRQADHYQALHSPDAIYSREGYELDPWHYLTLSPIVASKPRYDWIDLYFQVTEQGEWTSPNVPDAEVLSIINPEEWDQASAAGARKTLTWLREKLPLAELQIRLNRTLERDRTLGGSTEELETVAMAAAITRDEGAARRKAEGASSGQRVVQSRGRYILRSQQKYIPDSKCVPTEEEGEVPSVDVQISTLVPLWIDPQVPEDTKIAFVRTAHQASDTVYQGFVGDWGRLRAELLKRIVDDFPDADLAPIPEPADGKTPLESAASENEMVQLPVRLNVPEAVTGTNSEIWRSVRGTLLTSWAAAVAVLVLAGWGVWNLVSLTERRLQFAYAVTHELRTPLTTFRLYTDLLSAGLVPESSKQDYLETLNRESQRLATLVEDVLDYARLENQKVKLNPVEVKGPALLNTLTESLESRCKANGIASEAKSDIPDSQALRVDVDLVSQITNVLVDNACRYAKKSGRPAVLLNLESENGHLLLDVVDSGPGIERSDARKIFKPFRRGRNADLTAQGGIGLGLSLARNWAALLGGRLDLVARHHARYGGAHFRLTIPSRLANLRRGSG